MTRARTRSEFWKNVYSILYRYTWATVAFFIAGVLVGSCYF